jgi:hypothetical protein
LALAAAKRREFETSAKDAEGRFMTSRAEALAAEELGIPVEMQLREKAARLKGKKVKGFGWLVDRDGEPEDIPYTFVPWWHWGNLQRPGRTKWFTVAFYASLLTMAIIGLVAVTMRVLSGQ